MALSLHLDLNNLTKADLVTFAEHLRGHLDDDQATLSYDPDTHGLTLHYTATPTTTPPAPSATPAPTTPTPGRDVEDLFTGLVRDVGRKAGANAARDGAERFVRSIVEQALGGNDTPPRRPRTTNTQPPQPHTPPADTTHEDDSFGASWFNNPNHHRFDTTRDDDEDEGENNNRGQR